MAIKSGKKGKRGELEIVHQLNERFVDDCGRGGFSRSVGSGNRWGQGVQLSRQSIQTYAGDITCPVGFRFVVESKCGYNDVDLFTMFGGCCKELDTFLAQVESDAERCGRSPMLIWKKDRKEKIAFVRRSELVTDPDAPFAAYRGWLAVSLTWLLTLPDTFFFG